jgi:hypothetical protein
MLVATSMLFIATVVIGRVRLYTACIALMRLSAEARLLVQEAMHSAVTQQLIHTIHTLLHAHYCRFCAQLS